MQWFVLIPPLIILLTAFFTHNIILSVVVGIGSASLVLACGSPLAAAGIAFSSFVDQLMKTENIPLYGFLIILGGIIALINQTGGICRFSQLFTNRVRSQKTVESSSLLISLLLGVDDYLSVLTTGCIIKPLADSQKIPRTKLAFLLNTMGSPLMVLVPISSWIAFIVSQLTAAGVNTTPNALIPVDPFYLYLKSIPFIFYSFIVMGCTWFIVHARISYGPMHQQEVIAQQTGNLFGGRPPRFKSDATEPVPSTNTSIIDFIVPIASLLLFTAIGLPWGGGYWVFGGQYSLLESFTHLGTNIFAVLMLAATGSFILSCAVALIRKSLRARQIPELLWTALSLMYSSIIIIFCAMIFGAMIEKLQTGQYLATLILPYVHATLLPLIIFVISMLTALAVGSSWGTITINIPIALPIMIASAQQTGVPLVSMLVLAIGAILSGAIAGAQLCPISDPITMASTSSGCYQIDHVKTQSWYLLPVVAGTCCAFIANIFLPLHGALNGFASSAIGLTVSIGLLYGINRWQMDR